MLGKTIIKNDEVDGSKDNNKRDNYSGDDDSEDEDDAGNDGEDNSDVCKFTNKTKTEFVV